MQCKTLTYLLLLIPFYSYAQIAQIGEINPACQSGNGSVEIEIIEGDPQDYYYVWEHDGRSVLIQDDLPPGTYNFYIEDRDGCFQYIEVEILEVDECSATYFPHFDETTCIMTVDLSFFDGDGNQLDPALFTINWDSAPFEVLNGGALARFDMRSVPSINTCFSYSLANTTANQCCGDEVCATLVIPPTSPVCSFNPTCDLLINEVVRAESQDLRYLELLVASSEDCGRCDLRHTIIDDNNGEIIAQSQPTNGLGAPGLDAGYIRFSGDAAWSDVKSGSLIVIHDGKNGVLNASFDPTDSDNNFTYILPFDDVTRFRGYISQVQNNGSYPYNGFPTAPTAAMIKVSNSRDAVQIRKINGDIQHSIALGEENSTVVYSTPTSFTTYQSNTICVLDNITALGQENGYLCGLPSGSFLPSPGGFNSSANQTYIESLRACGGGSESITEGKRISLEKSMEVFPNPSNVQQVNAYLKGVSPGKGVFKVYSLNGRAIANVSYLAEESNFQVALHTLFDLKAASIYLLHFIDAEGNLFTSKIVKQ